jgi:predicted AAA+ superfamily ATPase
VTYGEAVAAAYPFHPELIRVLDKRIGSIALFQRARGALKLLA